MQEPQIDNLLKVGQLAKMAGVSVSTIHYYVQEGLLTAPIKTARNMAYYDPEAVQDIELIQELQAKRFLPLSAIKLILNAKHEGQSPYHIIEMQSFFDEVFAPVEAGGQTQNISFSELVSASGLPEGVIRDLEYLGFIEPLKAYPEHPTFTDIDVRIAQIFKHLAEMGVMHGDLGIYRQYIRIMRTEAKAIHEIVHRLPNHNEIPLRELFKTISELKKYLTMKVYREEAQHFHDHDE